MDRNLCKEVLLVALKGVALRKESVDRNLVVWAVTHVC